MSGEVRDVSGAPIGRYYQGQVLPFSPRSEVSSFVSSNSSTTVEKSDSCFNRILAGICSAECVACTAILGYSVVIGTVPALDRVMNLALGSGVGGAIAGILSTESVDDAAINGALLSTMIQFVTLLSGTPSKV